MPIGAVQPAFSTITGNLGLAGSGANMLAPAAMANKDPGAALMGVASNYASAYQDALQANQQNYQNVLQGYQQTLRDQQAAQQPILQGYRDLQSQVAGTIQGVDQSQRQAIADTYAQQRGQASQSLISRGLGNTTVQDAVNRGLTLDEQKAGVALSNQMAQLQAGYQSQLGGAALNYQNQAAMQNTALAGQQLGFMAGVQIPYPSASAYGSLASGLAGLQAARGAGGGGPHMGVQQLAGQRRGRTASEMAGGYNLGGSASTAGAPVPAPPPGYRMPGSYYDPALANAGIAAQGGAPGTPDPWAGGGEGGSWEGGGEWAPYGPDEVPAEWYGD
jgi:hypothetical protein